MENVALFSAELIIFLHLIGYSAYTDHHYSTDLAAIDPEARSFKQI